MKNKDDFRRKEIAPELNNENDKVQLHPNAEFLRQENTSSNEVRFGFQFCNSK